LNDQVEAHLIKAVTEEKVRITLPEGVKHYYVMEMLDEPNCVQKALNYGARLMGGKAMVRLGGLEKYDSKLEDVESVILAACGTSHFATKYVEILMRELQCFQFIECKNASEITS
jgi:glucosamine--fructose-6-phosphate aminotransferase (isomerizing)